MTLIFTDIEKKELLAIIYKEVLKKYAEIGGRSRAAFWSVAHYVGYAEEEKIRKTWYNLYYKKKHEILRKDKKGEAATERGLWDVWAYLYDHTKQPPFATDESTKTLIAENLIIDPTDVDFWERNRNHREMMEQDGYYDD